MAITIIYSVQRSLTSFTISIYQFVAEQRINTMKLTLALLLLVAFVCVSALPASTNNKKKVQAKVCPTTCKNPDKEDIICAEGGGLKVNFWNLCVLEKSNCENNRDMKKVKAGYCSEDNKNVRLS